MTSMLASVTTIEEARMALEAAVDIIDLKQPARGALGALDIGQVKAIVSDIDGQCPISATIGDMPMQPELVFNAVKAMAATGVDYIKIGFFPGDDWQGTLLKLKDLTQQSHALIAVLFADHAIDFGMLDDLKNAGFTGVMLDTMNKSNGSLTQLMEKAELERFVSYAKTKQLLCGLAGSLRMEDIPGLLGYQPDYLGFRGALCLQHNRTSLLNKAAVVQVKQAISSEFRPLAV